MKQRELAEQMGVHVTTVGYWERDRFFPEQHWAALNKLLHIDLRPPGSAERGLGPAVPVDVLAEEFGQEKADRLRREFGRRGENGEIALRALIEVLSQPAGDAAPGESRPSRAAG